MTVYLPPDVEANSVGRDWLVSSMRVDMQGKHELVRIWTRGALAGLLIVEPGDGALIAARLGMVDKPCPRCGGEHTTLEAHKP